MFENIITEKQTCKPLTQQFPKIIDFMLLSIPLLDPSVRQSVITLVKAGHLVTHFQVLLHFICLQVYNILSIKVVQLIKISNSCGKCNPEKHFASKMRAKVGEKIFLKNCYGFSSQFYPYQSARPNWLNLFKCHKSPQGPRTSPPDFTRFINIGLI